MGAEHIRIGILDLSAPAREPLARVRPEVEDALRIASWPTAPGVVQIARIDLGVIAPGTSRQALALRIAALAQGGIRASATHPVPQAAALHWPDRVELLAAVALQIDRAAPLDWWALQALACAPPGPARQRLAVAATRMAEASGSEALATLVLRIADLGGEGPCLTALAPVVERAGARRFPRVFGALASKLAQPLPGSAPAARPPATDPPSPLTAAPTLAAMLAHLPSPQDRIMARLIRTAALPPKALAALLVLTMSRLRGPGVVAEIVRRVGEAAVTAAAPVRADDAPVPILPPHQVRRRRTAASQGTPQPAQNHATPDPLPTPLPEGRTRLGGLVMLVNILLMAGGEAADRALDSGFGLRLIHGFLDRAGRDLDTPDQVIAALPQPPAFPLSLPRHPTAFLPADWLLALAPTTLALARVPGLPGLRAVMLPGGRGCLGLVDVPRLRGLRAGKTLTRHPAVPRDAIAAALLLGWQVLLARGFRALTRRTWRGTLLRDGYLAASTTHIDITLDIDTIRLPERRAGLDRTPGWVPLLSRVVSLHFERFHKPQGSTDAQ